jgi:hypothetical protein
MSERMLQPASQGALQIVHMVNWCLISNVNIANHLPILAGHFYLAGLSSEFAQKSRKKMQFYMYLCAWLMEICCLQAPRRVSQAFGPKLVSLLRIGQLIQADKGPQE